MSVRREEFQSTRPRGARLDFSLKLIYNIIISIHAPAWGATDIDIVDVMSNAISIHAPAWGATILSDENSLTLLISIHAPAWGATESEPLTVSLVLISIHAPAWGATVPVYTGLITAVALYFSRTSFLAVLLQAFFVAKSSV